MPVVLPEFLVVERFEGADRHHVGRQLRCRAEGVAQAPAPADQVALKGISCRAEQGQHEQTPPEVAADFPETERQGFLCLQVEDGVRGGVDLESRDEELQLLVGTQRIDDVLVGVERLGPPEVETALLESGQDVPLAQVQAAAFARKGIYRKRLDQLDAAFGVFAELRKFDNLHQVAVHLDRIGEAVADLNRVGLHARPDRRGLCTQSRRRSEGGAEQQRQSDRVFHRCLKSLMSSTT